MPVNDFTRKNSDTFFCRSGRDGAASSVFVFGKGFLDLLDDVCWMLPFNSDRQAKRARQDFSITEAAWNARLRIIRSEHRAEAAKTELAQAWKQRLMSKGGGAAAAPAAGAAAAAAEEASALRRRSLRRTLVSATWAGSACRPGPEARLLGAAGDHPEAVSAVITAVVEWRLMIEAKT